MDKGREVFRQADAFLQITASAKNPIIPQAKESKEVSYNLMISDILKRSLKGDLSNLKCLCLVVLLRLWRLAGYWCRSLTFRHFLTTIYQPTVSVNELLLITICLAILSNSARACKGKDGQAEKSVERKVKISIC